MSGMLSAMYSVLKRSSRKNRGLLDAGASRSKAVRNTTSQKTVYIVLIGNSPGVNNRGNSETWPATASGRNVERCRLSRSAIKLKGIMTRRIAFSWTCQPNKNEAYPQSVTAPMKFSHVGCANSLIKGKP